MADPNPAEAAIQAWLAQAATNLASANTTVTSKTAELASVVKAAAEAEAEHIRALAVAEAAKAAPMLSKVAANVESGVSTAWKWVIGAGAPAVLAAGAGLWAYWPKL